MLKPCDSKIYEKGIVVAIIADRNAQEIESLVTDARKQTGQRVDWHYIGGRGVIKVIGNTEKVINYFRPHFNNLFIEYIGG
jgi:hypothetical protein